MRSHDRTLPPTSSRVCGDTAVHAPAALCERLLFFKNCMKSHARRRQGSRSRGPDIEQYACQHVVL
eukprot:7672-Heterococcus_DN1.PRE.2